MERQNAEQWDGVKLDVLATAYMEVRREMWSLLANRVGEKWTLVEQKVRYNSNSNSIDKVCMHKSIASWLILSKKTVHGKGS